MFPKFLHNFLLLMFKLIEYIDTDHSGKYVIEKLSKNINATKNTTANKYFAF